MQVKVGFVGVLVAAALFGCGPSNTVSSACPSSTACVHFVTPTQGTGTGGNGAGTGGNRGTSDMARASSSSDMAQASSGDPDMASSPPIDMATAPADMLSCLPTGGDCTGHNDAICCSKYCVYATNTCK